MKVECGTSTTLLCFISPRLEVPTCFSLIFLVIPKALGKWSSRLNHTLDGDLL